MHISVRYPFSFVHMMFPNSSLFSPFYHLDINTGNESCGQVYEEWRCQVQGDVREEDETACQR